MTPIVHPSQETNLTDETPRLKGWLASWRPDVMFWAVVSVTGWIVVAFMFSTMMPEDQAEAAAGSDATNLSRIAPAAGPATRRAD